MLSKVILALAFGAASASLTSDWQKFKVDFKKEYATAEEEHERFQIFAANMEKAVRLTAEEKTATYGVTRFADLTAAEFKRDFLGYKGQWHPFANSSAPLKKYELECTACKRFPENAKLMHAVPDAYDWVEKGAVTDVKDQGYCGSCWSFGTTGDVEGVTFLAGGDLTPLSEQQLVSCDFRTNVKDGLNLGCNGGLQESAFNYLINEAPFGLVSEATYPYSRATYTGTTGDCDTSLVTEDNVVATISSWSQVSDSASGESDIYSALVASGPVTIGINAENMQLYQSGIANPSVCPASGVDHAVLIVGYGSQLGTDYWKIKNSWSDSWGEDGYYRIVAGSNACGLATDVVHSAV